MLKLIIKGQDCKGPGTGYNLTCHECPADSTCSVVGITLDSLPIPRGHFRFSPHDDEVHECPGWDLCKKGKSCACAGSFAVAAAAAVGGVNATSGVSITSAVTAGDALCAVHSTGPFCMLCEDGYYRKGSSVGSGGWV